MDFIQVAIPYSEILNNPQIQQLAIAAVLGGAKVQGTTTGVTTYGNIANDNNTYEMLTYQVLTYVISLGGEIYNYQSYIGVDLTSNVPNYIRDYQTISEDGVQPVTWEQWLAVGQTSITVDGITYISGYSHYSGYSAEAKPAKHLTGTELVALIADGYTVLNKEEFTAAMPTNPI